MKDSLAGWNYWSLFTLDALVTLGFGNGGGRLALIPDAWFDDLPAGLKLTCLDGSTAVVGSDYIDRDTSCGFLAYGILAYPTPVAS